MLLRFGASSAEGLRIGEISWQCTARAKRDKGLCFKLQLIVENRWEEIGRQLRCLVPSFRVADYTDTYQFQVKLAN